jgi:hypothetical protein
MTTPNIEIRRGGLERILDLRHRILRAGLPRESARFECQAGLERRIGRLRHTGSRAARENEQEIKMSNCA